MIDFIMILVYGSLTMILSMNANLTIFDMNTNLSIFDNLTHKKKKKPMHKNHIWERGVATLVSQTTNTPTMVWTIN